MGFNPFYNNNNQNYDMMMFMNQTSNNSFEDKDSKNKKGENFNAHVKMLPSNQKSLIGVITKFQSGIGYIDDLIFFDTTALQGCYPKIGDKVLVDASYDENVPLKWKAFRVQTINKQPSKHIDTNKPPEKMQSFKNFTKHDKSNSRHENIDQYHKKTKGSGFVDYDAPPVDPNVSGMFNFMMQGAGPNLDMSLGNTNPMLNNDLSAATAAFMMAAAGGGLGNMLPNPAQSLINPSFAQQQDYSLKGMGGDQRIHYRNQDRSSRSQSRGRYKPDRPGSNNLPRYKGGERRPYDDSNDHRRPTFKNGNADSHLQKRKRSSSPFKKDKVYSGQSFAPNKIVHRTKNHIPRMTFAKGCTDTYALWNRFPNLYVPSEFVMAQGKWMDTFPIDNPLNLNVYSQFHIYDKKEFEENDVDYNYKPSFPQLFPSDAGTSSKDLISVKVMLLCCPGLQVLYNKSFGYDGIHIDESPRNFQHPSKLIKFLLAHKGKKENMAIGGPWSPELDGPDPDNNPKALINTAIRTTKNVTGIDLSACVNWYRFLEIYYRRDEPGDKNKLNAPGADQSTCPSRGRMEKVYVLLPDVWSIIAPRCIVGIGTEKAECGSRMVGETADGYNDGSKGVSCEASPAIVNQESIGILGDVPLDPKSANSAQPGPTGSEERLDDQGLRINDFSLKVEPSCREDLNGPRISENKDTLKVETNDAQKKPLKTPSEPSILVFSSKTAKNGKFECSLVSLSNILNYTADDTKEYVFEVSLFAEAFNGMLQRDFGYNIYRALCNNFVSNVNRSSTVCDDLKSKNIIKEEDSNDQIDKSEMVKGDLGENDTDKITEGSKRLKPYVKDPFLLLSFSYFDTSFNGYLSEKDLEAITFSLNLALSRAQIKEILAPLISKDFLNYRVLTDDHYDENGPIPVPIISSTFINEEYKMGNKLCIKELSQMSGNISSGMPGEQTKYAHDNFSHVDVPNLLKRLQTLEEASLISVNKLAELNKHSSSLKLSLEKETARVKLYEDDIKKLDDKLRSNCKETEATKKEFEEAKKAIKYSLENIKNSSRKLEAILTPTTKELNNEADKIRPA